MRERAVPPDDILPTDFFMRWVPEAVAGDDDRRRKLGGTKARILFDLTGEGGGAFTLDIHDGYVAGKVGAEPEPDLRVELDVPTWRALNRGEISAPEALLRRRVHIHGSFLLALKLHLILG